MRQQIQENCKIQKRKKSEKEWFWQNLNYLKRINNIIFWGLMTNEIIALVLKYIKYNMI